jgi:hypothetical protein
LREFTRVSFCSPYVAPQTPVDDNAELLYLLARGRLVHATVAPFAEHVQHPDVVAIPLRDLPSSTCALAGLSDVIDPNRDALLDIVEELSTTS